jgi:hypothetical protein
MEELDELLVEESNEELYKLESLRGEIPMKQLSLDELLAYADHEYFENSPAHDELIKFLEKYDQQIMEFPVVRRIILSRLNRKLMRTDDNENTIPDANIYDYESDEDFMQKLRVLVSDVEKHTRKWSKNGWKPVELE